jgi:hypothetical protein
MPSLLLVTTDRPTGVVTSYSEVDDLDAAAFRMADLFTTDVASDGASAHDYVLAELDAWYRTGWAHQRDFSTTAKGLQRVTVLGSCHLEESDVLAVVDPTGHNYPGEDQEWTDTTDQGETVPVLAPASHLVEPTGRRCGALEPHHDFMHEDGTDSECTLIAGHEGEHQDHGEVEVTGCVIVWRHEDGPTIRYGAMDVHETAPLPTFSRLMGAAFG